MRDDVRSIGRCQTMKRLFYLANTPMNTLRIPNYNLGSQSIIFPKTHEDNLLCQQSWTQQSFSRWGVKKDSNVLTPPRHVSERMSQLEKNHQFSMASKGSDRTRFGVRRRVGRVGSADLSIHCLGCGLALIPRGRYPWGVETALTEGWGNTGLK